MAAKINNEPLVSVVTTSYNYAHLISFAIESVLAQDYTNLELIIVDDGSADNSLEIINKYCGKYNNIRLLTHSNNKNLGLAESMKLGIENAKGEIIAFLESDDTWLTGNLSEKVNVLLNEPDISAVFSSVELTGDDISKKYQDYITYVEWAGRKLNKMPGNQINLLLLRNPAATFSNIIFKSKVLKNFELNKNFEKWLDWQFLINASYQDRIKYIDKKLVCWRIHTQSLHYTHIEESGSKNLSEQKLQFLNEIKQRNNIENVKQLGLKYNLEFAILHPIITIRKIFNLYGY